ncbi:hypothetical protein SCALM49S_02211 [Streptomyces californicus]
MKRSERPDFSIRARASSPPPDRAIETAAAFGPTVPSERRSSVASGACHPPAALATRTGTTDCSRVNVAPSGLAYTVAYSVRRDSTSVRVPRIPGPVQGPFLLGGGGRVLRRLAPRLRHRLTG